jgi:hypothetical protein
MLLSQAITLVFEERGGLREKLETARGYERDARHFCVFVRNPQIQNIRLDDIEQFFLTMEELRFFSQRNTNEGVRIEKTLYGIAKARIHRPRSQRHTAPT